MYIDIQILFYKQIVTTLSIIDGTYTDSWMTESNEEEMCSLYNNYGNHDDHMLMEPVDMIVEVSSAD